MKNILIYHMHEMELRMQSYDAMNMGTKCQNIRDRGIRGQPQICTDIEARRISPENMPETGETAGDERV